MSRENAALAELSAIESQKDNKIVSDLQDLLDL